MRATKKKGKTLDRGFRQGYPTETRTGTGLFFLFPSREKRRRDAFSSPFLTFPSRQGGCTVRTTKKDARQGGCTVRTTKKDARQGGCTVRTTKKDARQGGSTVRTTKKDARQGGRTVRATKKTGKTLDRGFRQGYPTETRTGTGLFFLFPSREKRRRDAFSSPFLTFPSLS